MKRFTVQFFVFICAMVLFLSSSAFAANTIKIGIADSYSGPAAIFGLDMRDGGRHASRDCASAWWLARIPPCRQWLETCRPYPARL